MCLKYLFFLLILQQNSHVPEFGNWKDEVQYTAHFDNARKGKSSGKTNPNDPGDKLGSNKAEGEARKGSEALRSKNEQHLSREVGHPRRSTDSPLHHDTVGQRFSSDSPLHHHGGSSGDVHKRAMRQSVGSDRSIEHSPLHPHNQARVGGKSNDVSSPSWERKGSSQGSSHSLAPSTPGRSRLRSVTRGDETVISSLSSSFSKFPKLHEHWPE